MKRAVILFTLLLVAPPVPALAVCAASPPPDSWSSENEAVPAAAPDDPTAVNPLTLVIFRHAEKPLRDDGLMIEDGNLGRESIERLSGLPDSLLRQFGCPDLLVAANPAVKMLNKITRRYFNYVRPLTTIAPLAQKIDFPVWTPYGYTQSDSLARDLLGDRAFLPTEDGKAKKIFIVWERNNIARLFDQLKTRGRLRPLAGETLTVDGVEHRCEEPRKWEQCDFDSIWLVQIRNGAICLSRRSENLNSESFQRRCKGAESATDRPDDQRRE